MIRVCKAMAWNADMPMNNCLIWNENSAKTVSLVRNSIRRKRDSHEVIFLCLVGPGIEKNVKSQASNA